MTLRRTSTSLIHLLAPQVQDAVGPVCLTCGRLLDFEGVVEGEPGKTGYAKVLGKHHGAEELRTFDMGSVEWDYDDLASLMKRASWFDPQSHDGIALGKIVTPDHGADPTMTGRVFSDGSKS